MNKSKFLKKSLAMVLAVMLVVAMIPMSASAAALPNLTAISIGETSSSGKVVTAENTTFKADISSGADSIYVMATVGQGATLTAIALADGDDVEIDDTAAAKIELDKFYKNASTSNTITIPLVLTDADDITSKDYSIVLTRTSAKTGTDLVKAEFEDQISSKVDNTKRTIDVKVPKGYNLDASHTMTFETKDEATIGGSTSGTETVTFSEGVNSSDVIVTSQSGGNTAYYTVTLTEVNILTGFAVDGNSATIDQDENTIDVTVPADTLLDEDGKTLTKLSLPVTFTKAYATATVELPKGTAFTSGKKVDFAASLLAGSDYTATVTVTYNNTAVDYDLTVTTSKSKDNAITEATISNEAATVSGSTIKVDLAKGTDLGTIDEMSFTVADTVATVTVLANGSKVNGSFTDADPDDGVKVWGMTDASVNLKNGASVTVEAADGTTKTYTVSATATAVVNEPSITAMTLQDGDENTYKATLSGNTFTFTVPYMTIDMTAWKFFFAGTTNTTFTNFASDVLKSGQALGNVTVAGANQIEDTLTGTVTATSKSTDGGKSTYKVVIKLADPNESRKANVILDKFSVTYADKVANVASNNTVAAAANSDKTEYTATIAHSATKTYLTSFATKNAGVLFYKGSAPSDTYAKVELTDKDAFGTEFVDGGSLLVMPETAAKSAIISGTFNESLGNKYAYKIAHKAPVGDNQLKTLKFDEKSVNLSNMTVQLPFGLTVEELGDANADSAVYPTFTISDLASLTATSTTGTAVFVSEGDKDDDGEAKDISATNAALQFVRNANDDKVKVYMTQVSGGTAVANDEIKSLVVKAENGSERTYTFGTITYAAANTQAKFNSFKLANSSASINGSTISVTVPYGTKLSSLVPTFSVSSGATVTYGADKVTSGETAIDFSNDVILKVTSEDGLKVVPYTVKVTVASQFSDVKESDWYYNDVMTAAANGWVKGVGDGKFNPAGSMKRGDFAVMIANVMGADLSDYKESAFPDVASSKYYSAPIAFCADKGYISGDEKGNFNPEATITREQMARIICDAKGLTQVTNPSKKYADDAKIAGWAKGYVYACTEAGIFKGDEKNNFNPKSNAKRSEGAAVLVRAFA